MNGLDRKARSLQEEGMPQPRLSATKSALHTMTSLYIGALEHLVREHDYSKGLPEDENETGMKASLTFSIGLLYLILGGLRGGTY